MVTKKYNVDDPVALNLLLRIATTNEKLMVWTKQSLPSQDLYPDDSWSSNFKSYFCIISQKL